jgi:hypothetical protein
LKYSHSSSCICGASHPRTPMERIAAPPAQQRLRGLSETIGFNRCDQRQFICFSESSPPSLEPFWQPCDRSPVDNSGSLRIDGGDRPIHLYRYACSHGRPPACREPYRKAQACQHAAAGHAENPARHRRDFAGPRRDGLQTIPKSSRKEMIENI